MTALYGKFIIPHIYYTTFPPKNQVIFSEKCTFFSTNLQKHLTTGSLYGIIKKIILGIKEACNMEMQIAATAMAMAMQNMQNGLAVSMLKETLEASEQSMEIITDMLDNVPIPSPDGRGQLLDVRV